MKQIITFSLPDIHTSLSTAITNTHTNMARWDGHTYPPFSPQLSYRLTSNVTIVIEVRSASTCVIAGAWHPWWMLIQHSIMLWLCFIVKCGTGCFLYAMHVLSGIILIPGLPLCQVSILPRPPLLSSATEKKCILNHSLSLFDAPGTEAQRFGILSRVAIQPLFSVNLSQSIYLSMYVCPRIFNAANSDIEYVGKYSVAAISYWNNFRQVFTHWNKIISIGHQWRMK